MLNKIVPEKFYCGMDIGAQTIKAALLKIKGLSDFDLAGVYEHKTYGYKNNSVTDLDVFCECIHDTLQELGKRTGTKIRDVQVGIGGAMVDSRRTDTVIPLIDRGSKVITHRDIRKVNNHARLLGIQMEEEILHDLPQQYRVDDMNFVHNPLGLYGRKLGVHSLMIVINENRVRNIAKAVHQAGYDVRNMFFNSFASSEVIFSDEERQRGCLLVDVGGQSTTVLVFKEGALQGMKVIGAGGQNITASISDHLGLPVDLAEEIKKSYAAVSGSEGQQEEEILVKKEETYTPIKRGVIFGAIRGEVDQMVSQIRQVIISSGMKDQKECVVAVIGGGALLPGLLEQIGQNFPIPVRLGKLNLSLQKPLNYTAIFSSVVGLARCGYKKTFKHALAHDSYGHWTKNLTNRMRELYQEYF